MKNRTNVRGGSLVLAAFTVALHPAFANVTRDASIHGSFGGASGGRYSVVHSIGQPLVGESAHGERSFQAGHLGDVVIMTTPEAPPLDAVREGNEIVLRWQGEGAFGLERSNDMRTWVPCESEINRDGLAEVVRETVAESRMYYRLTPVAR